MDFGQAWRGAIDFGGTKTAMALVAPDGRVGHRLRFWTPRQPDPDTMCDLIAQQWAALLAQSGGPEVAGVGVAAPGPADAAAGILHQVFDWPWRDVPLAAVLSRRLGLPVRLDNDVNCCCQAEGRFGVARGVRDYAWIQVSTGVGGALCLGGQVYAGARGLAGEVGHLILDEGGPPCACGRRGCLQALVSGPALARRFHEAGGRAGERAEAVFAAAGAGDPRARAVLAAAARDLGRGLAIVVNLLNPEMLVLGGGVMESFAPLLPAVRQAVRERVIGEANREVAVVRSGIGYDAALLGAAVLVER